MPILIEIGPRDIAGDTLMPKRRDEAGGEKKPAVPRGQFVASAAGELAAMQKNLFERALAHRAANTRTITSLADFEAYFTPQNAEQARDARRVRDLPFRGKQADGRHSGQAQSDDPLHPASPTKPGFETPVSGKCIFTGQETTQRAVFAKAY